MHKAQATEAYVNFRGLNYSYIDQASLMHMHPALDKKNKLWSNGARLFLYAITFIMVVYRRSILNEQKPDLCKRFVPVSRFSILSQQLNCCLSTWQTD